MSDLEQQLTHLLATPPRATADEPFVAGVMLEVAAAERRRRLVLGALTVIVAGLASSLAFGLKLAATAWNEVVSQLPAAPAAAVQLPTLAVFVLGSLLLLLLARDPGVS